MAYESSYESGRTPFVPDAKRGYWTQPSDFIYACLGLAFKMDIFSMTWFFFFEMGIYAIIPYILCLVVYVVPVFFVQAFLGQFSSSGFISSLRLSPLFKGIGYVGLALNVTILMYIGTYAAVPLLFLFHSFRPTLPWSCEVEQKDIRSNNYCKLTNWNDSTTTTTTTTSSADVDLTNTTTARNRKTDFSARFEIPSEAFFESLFSKGQKLAWSWQLLIFLFVVWALIAIFFYKITDLEKISLFIRYSIWTIISLMLLCIVRFLFLDIGTEAIQDFFHPSWRSVTLGIHVIPTFVLTAFASGWGVVTSLASYNKFQINLMRYSWIICAAHGVINILFGLTLFLLTAHFEAMFAGSKYYFYHIDWTMFLSSGTAMANMRLANMWCILFFSMLTLSAMLMIVVQLLAIFTAIFDDFEFLRMRRMEVKFGLIGFLALTSIYFCSNRRLNVFLLRFYVLITHASLNLLMILVVLWIYGRERFQRDIEFMLRQPFASWRVFMLRFIVPIALTMTLDFSLSIANFGFLKFSVYIDIIAVFIIFLTLIGVPGYAAFRMWLLASGSFWDRFKRCTRPTDWYPVEADNRQRYEEAIGNMDITHQLIEVGDEIH